MANDFPLGAVELNLLHARWDVRESDKALARELYHQLQERGMQGHQIDSWEPGVTGPAVVLPVGPVEVIEPDTAPLETADAPEAPGRAVKRRGGGK